MHKPKLDIPWARIALAIVAMVLLGLYLTNRVDMRKKHPYKTLSDIEEDSLLEVFSNWEVCVRAVLKEYRDKKEFEEFWSSAWLAINECEEMTGMERVRPTKMENGEDDKWHILPQDNDRRSVIVSLGIGRNVGAEENMQRRLAQSTAFFGADPVEEENREMYERIGKFFPMAVGGEDGEVEARVLLPGSDTDYFVRKVRMMELSSFLETEVLGSVNSNATSEGADVLTEETAVRESIIDHLIVDIEGGEYGVLGQFLSEGALDKKGITLCQANMEMHLPSSSQHKLVFDWFSRLVSDRRYVFGRMQRLHYPDAPQPVDVLRVYLFNRQNTKCVERYLTQFF